MIPFKTIPLRPVSKLTSCSTVLTTKRTRFLNAQSNGFKVQLTTSQKLACTVCGKIIPLIAKIKTKLIRKVEIRGKYFFISRFDLWNRHSYNRHSPSGIVEGDYEITSHNCGTQVANTICLRYQYLRDGRTSPRSGE